MPAGQHNEGACLGRCMPWRVYALAGCSIGISVPFVFVTNLVQLFFADSLKYKLTFYGHRYPVNQVFFLCVSCKNPSGGKFFYAPFHAAGFFI